MPRWDRRRLQVLALTFGYWLGLCVAAVPAADEAEQFFESQVRPLLHRRCVACHGPDKQQGDLRLDQRAVVLGHDGNGLAVPHQPDASRLLQVVRYTDGDTQMPPSGKLPPDEIAILTQWITAGAYWPAEETAAPTPIDGQPRLPDGTFDFVAAAAQHWAYRPVVKPPVPHATAAANPIDAFLLDRLGAAGLEFSPRADRRTLIRRVYLDLLGIPPTFEEVAAFKRDDRPDAWPRLVDRLLASPLYGQRWGRHWLDVARYGDTKGYVFTQNPKYPYSFTYRDYVVDAFNADKPFDEFVVEQLAADQLGLPAGDSRLAALGFITTGPRYLNREPDIIDDRIDLVTRGLMGMTLACGRCHDHKYDPLPTADYYSLYGVFASSMEPEELPQIGDVDDSPEYRTFLAELEKRQRAVDDFRASTHAELLRQMRVYAGDYLLAVLQASGKIPEGMAVTYQHGNPREKLRERWAEQVERRLREHDPVFIPWKVFVDLPPENFGPEVDRLLSIISEEGTPLYGTCERIREALVRESPRSMVDVARIYGRVMNAVDSEWQAMLAEAAGSPPTSMSDPAAEQVRVVLYGPGSITDIPVDATRRLFERDNRDKLQEFERKVDEWKVESPDGPPRAMVLLDKGSPEEPVVFIRGDQGRRGDRVPRQPPRILTGGESRAFQNGSGRRELAECIVAADNPLTARVIVNRVWHWHMGRGLVATLSDFGTRSDPPTHPELLDWLAWELVHVDDWSLQALHRKILLSTVYQQASVDRPDARAVDPENVLYWRMNRQRLDFEGLRDSLLAVSGQLDPAIGGRPFDIEGSSVNGRRSIYARIDRNNFSPLLRTFDFASPDATSPGRPLTTVPQQALFAMNSPFLREIARSAVAEATGSNAMAADQEIVTRLFRRILAREPTESELLAGTEFLHNHDDGANLLAHALLMANEFAFAD